MQACLSVVSEPRGQYESSIEKELDNFGSPELTSPGEGRPYLLGIGALFQRAVLVEEVLNHIEPSNARRAFEIQSRASLGEELRGLTPSIRETSVDGALSGLIDPCSVFEQQLE